MSKILFPGRKMVSNKLFMSVRDPLDVFISQLNLYNTGSHSVSLPYDVPTRDPKWFEDMIEGISKTHKAYFDILFRDVIDAKSNPLYIVRYEDLVSEKEDALKGLFCFLLDLPTLEGTNAERMI